MFHLTHTQMDCFYIDSSTLSLCNVHTNHQKSSHKHGFLDVLTMSCASFYFGTRIKYEVPTQPSIYLHQAGSSFTDYCSQALTSTFYPLL